MCHKAPSPSSFIIPDNQNSNKTHHLPLFSMLRFTFMKCKMNLVFFFYFKPLLLSHSHQDKWEVFKMALPPSLTYLSRVLELVKLSLASSPFLVFLSSPCNEAVSTVLHQCFKTYGEWHLLREVLEKSTAPPHPHIRIYPACSDCLVEGLASFSWD